MSTATPLVPEIALIMVTSLKATYSSIFPLPRNAGKEIRTSAARSSVDPVSHYVEAEGWYEDPFTVHQHRWFSAGVATSLVRDDGIEGKDPPPDDHFDGPLVMVTSEKSDSGGNDLRRVGDRQGEPYDPLKAFDKALDATTWWPMQ